MYSVLFKGNIMEMWMILVCLASLLYVNIMETVKSSTNVIFPGTL